MEGLNKIDGFIAKKSNDRGSRSITLNDISSEHGFIKIMEAHTIAVNKDIDEGGISTILDKPDNQKTAEDCASILEMYLRPFSNWADSLKQGKQSTKVLKVISNIPHVKAEAKALSETYIHNLKKVTNGDISEAVTKTIKQGQLNTEVSDTEDMSLTSASESINQIPQLNHMDSKIAQDNNISQTSRKIQQPLIKIGEANPNNFCKTNEKNNIISIGTTINHLQTKEDFKNNLKNNKTDVNKEDDNKKLDNIISQIQITTEKDDDDLKNDLINEFQVDSAEINDLL